MQTRSPENQKLVRSEFSEQLIPITSEAWRHECEVAFLLGLPSAMQNELMDGSSAPNHPNARGIQAARGDGVVAMLRAEIRRLAEIRLRRTVRR